MTQQEFESRTQVKVSINEWLAIDQIYSLSDVDKDTFCKLWCKMNASRVKAAKEQRNFIENRLHIPFIVEAPDGHSYRHFVSGVIAKVNEYLFGK